MIETVAPETRPRRAKAAVAGIALLAVLAVGAALVLPGGNDEPSKLALATDASGAARDGGLEMQMGAPSADRASGAGAASSSMIAPGWYGLEFRVEGDLPGLGGRAPAWQAVALKFDRAQFTSFARSLGLAGDVVDREGGFALETGEGALNAFPGPDGWSLNFYRQAAAGNAPAPLAIAAAEAEDIARRLLVSIGALPGEWKVRAFETETGYGYACASDLKGLEAQSAVEPGFSPDCPPPPPPVKAWNVVFTPLLDDVSSNWTPWNMTLSGAGRIENLYGTLARFERVGDFELRGTTAALAELRANSAGDGALREPMPMPMPMPEGPMADEAVTQRPAGPTGAPDTITDPGTEPDPDPGTGGMPYPGPPEPAKPQVVTITGVERSLTAMPVWVDAEQMRMHLVPAYRFTGRFESGDAWETTVIALHPDAIAPPPAKILDRGPEGGTGTVREGGTGTVREIEPDPAVQSKNAGGSGN